MASREYVGCIKDALDRQENFYLTILRQLKYYLG